jgi:hypothetical protein
LEPSALYRIDLKFARSAVEAIRVMVVGHVREIWRYPTKRFIVDGNQVGPHGQARESAHDASHDVVGHAPRHRGP